MVNVGKESKPQCLTLSLLRLFGKPLLLTDLQGGSSYIDNSKPGVPVLYGDTAALRNGIGLLLERPQETRAVGNGPSTGERHSALIWHQGLELVRVRSAATRPLTLAQVGL
jgi:hypothetical protein